MSKLDTRRNVQSEHRCFQVSIVEDKPLTRESWRRLIAAIPEFKCTYTYSSGEEALKELPVQRPDIVLMDIRMPGLSGIESTAQIKSACPEILIVMLTDCDDDEVLFSALEAGADGYLLKRTTPADLRSALLDVLDGGAPMTSEIARRVIRSFRQKKTGDVKLNLSSREEEVLKLLARGYSNKEIAVELGVAIETVRSHLKHIYEKMHVRSRGEAVAHYLGFTNNA